MRERSFADRTLEVPSPTWRRASHHESSVPVAPMVKVRSGRGRRASPPRVIDRAGCRMPATPRGRGRDLLVVTAVLASPGRATPSRYVGHRGASHPQRERPRPRCPTRRDLVKRVPSSTATSDDTGPGEGEPFDSRGPSSRPKVGADVSLAAARRRCPALRELIVGLGHRRHLRGDRRQAGVVRLARPARAYRLDIVDGRTGLAAVPGTDEKSGIPKSARASAIRDCARRTQGDRREPQGMGRGCIRSPTSTPVPVHLGQRPLGRNVLWGRRRGHISHESSLTQEEATALVAS